MTFSRLGMNPARFTLRNVGGDEAVKALAKMWPGSTASGCQLSRTSKSRSKKWVNEGNWSQPVKYFWLMSVKQIHSNSSQTTNSITIPRFGRGLIEINWIALNSRLLGDSLQVPLTARGFWVIPPVLFCGTRQQDLPSLKPWYGLHSKWMYFVASSVNLPVPCSNRIT